MAYKAVTYKRAGAYTAGDVILDQIPIRNPGVGLLTVFVKLSAGTLSHIELYNSVDGSDWRNAQALAAYQSSTLWAFKSYTDVDDYPAGTLLQLRCVTGNITVSDIKVVQDW